MHARGEGSKKRKAKTRAAPTAQADAPRLIERDGKILIHIPMAFARRGGRKEIILPPACRPDGDRAYPSINQALAIAVALGHRWLGLLMEGRFGSVGELAEHVGIDPSQLRRHLSLTCLSPRLLGAILAGKEPNGMSLEGLRELPMHWEKQG